MYCILETEMLYSIFVLMSVFIMETPLWAIIQNILIHCKHF